MSSLLTKAYQAIFGVPARQPIKVAIIGLDGAGQEALIRGISQTPVEDHTGPTMACRYTGTYNTLGFHFVATELGGSAPTRHYIWVAEQYRDAGAIVWMIDGTDKDRLAEAAQEMKIAAKGRKLSSNLVQPSVQGEAPWLILVNFKNLFGQDMARASHMIEVCQPDALNLDWTFRTVSYANGEGVTDGMIWLRSRLIKEKKFRREMRQVHVS